MMQRNNIFPQVNTDVVTSATTMMSGAIADGKNCIMII